MAYPILAAQNTWYKGSTAKNTITEINIVDSYTTTGSETESWNADVDNSGSIKCYVTGTVLTIAGNGSGKIAANADSSWAFSDPNRKDYFKNMTKIENANLFDTSNATTFERLFQSCEKMTSVDVSNWNTGNVEKMNYTFSLCYAIESLAVDNWNTGKASTMNGMFQVAKSLKTLDLSKWNVENVEDMKGMFMSTATYGAMALTSIGDVSEWKTGNVQNMQAMFQWCTSLKSLDLSGWNVGEVKNMQNMFCSSDESYPMLLETIGDVSNWNVSKVQTMQGMFQFCKSLKNLDTSGWTPFECLSMQNMFNHCSSLTSIGDTSGWTVSKVTTMLQMFSKCTSLEELDVSNWDVSKVTTFKQMFASAAESGVGSGNPALKELDVSNWKTASATDMSFMFYGCTVGSVDVSGWDVSKVQNFDHMFAHSQLTVNGTGNWVTTAATNMNALFHSIQNTSIDVSKFNTSKVQFFSQMFQNASKLTEIIGLENFVTTNVVGFEEMFQNCHNLKKLDLSSFDTTHAKDGVTASVNGHKTLTMSNFFQNNHRLEEIKLGENFSFVGDGTTTDTSHYAVLPTPSSTYITGADGNWYTINATAYAPADIPSNAANTYYASLTAVRDMDVLMKNGTLIDIAAAIKSKNNSTDVYLPSEFATTISAL